MKLKEAIKIGTRYLEGSDEAAPVEFDKFVQLGTEALEFRLRWEQQEGEEDFPLLPSETKD